jgi:hypothetical protein
LSADARLPESTAERGWARGAAARVGAMAMAIPPNAIGLSCRILEMFDYSDYYHDMLNNRNRPRYRPTPARAP